MDPEPTATQKIATYTIGYGPIIVTVMVLAIFAFTYVAPAFGLTVPTDNKELLNNAVLLVLGYQLGSSVSSRAKDALLGLTGR